MSRFFKAWAAYSGILVKLAPQALQGELATSLFIYTMNLYDLLEKYTWDGVKAYDFQFHCKQVAGGNSVYYPNDWWQIDSEFIASKCFAHPYITRHPWPTSQNCQPRSHAWLTSCQFEKVTRFHPSRKLALLQPCPTDHQIAGATHTAWVTLPLLLLLPATELAKLQLRYAEIGTTLNAGPHTAAIITFAFLVEATIRPHNPLREIQPALTRSALAPIHVSCPTIFNIIDVLPLFLSFFSLLPLAPYPMYYIKLTSLNNYIVY